MRSLLVFSLTISTISAFLFPMPSGGGGGCGCAPPPPPPMCAPPPPPCPPPPPPPCPPPCPPPPPPSCGCGRKKREVEGEAIHGNTDFLRIEENLECNSEELREILKEKMRDTSKTSIKSFKSSLGEDLFVVCSSGVMNYAAPSATKHCAIRNKTHFCQIFEL